MQNDNAINRMWQAILTEIRQLLVWNTPSRSWHIAFIVSLCMGIPVFAGAYFGKQDYGILVGMGTLVILYLPKTSIAHRMLTLVACSFGFSVCFTLGLCASFDPYISVAVMTLTVLLIDVICRYYSLPPPASFFFILMIAVGSTMPFNLAGIPMRVGLISIGGMLACLIAFIYSLAIANKPIKLTPVPPVDRDIFAIVLESLVIASFVGGSFLLSRLLHLNNPYWVPVSCAAIMQGATFRLIWHKKVHRIIGTALGMGLTSIIFSLPLNVWTYALAITVLQFIVEILIVRNYGVAVIFITPLTMLFAEGASVRIPPDSLVLTRLFDIILGSLIGVAGGWVLHHPKILTHVAGKVKSTTQTTTRAKTDKDPE